MSACSLSDTLNLLKGEIVRVEDPGIIQINVLSGIIWFTGTPSSGDILLKRGECHCFGKEYPHVIEAMTEATVLLIHAHDLKSCQKCAIKRHEEPGVP